MTETTQPFSFTDSYLKFGKPLTETLHQAYDKGVLKLKEANVKVEKWAAKTFSKKHSVTVMKIARAVPVAAFFTLCPPLFGSGAALAIGSISVMKPSFPDKAAGMCVYDGIALYSGISGVARLVYATSAQYFAANLTLALVNLVFSAISFTYARHLEGKITLKVTTKPPTIAQKVMEIATGKPATTEKVVEITKTSTADKKNDKKDEKPGFLTKFFSGVKNEKK